jgi:hypothetical protein
MEKKQIQALKRLAPKLSALRKALRGEERLILDEMVKAYQSEVTAHSAEPASRKLPAQSSEVSMHSTTVGQKSLGRKTPSVDSQKSFGRASIDLKASIYRVDVY